MDQRRIKAKLFIERGLWECRGNGRSKRGDQLENSKEKQRENQGDTSENKWEENKWEKNKLVGCNKSGP